VAGAWDQASGKHDVNLSDREQHLAKLALHALTVVAMNSESTLTKQEVNELALAALAVLDIPVPEDK